MKFMLIDGAKAAFPEHRLCSVLGVSQSGYFAWKGRPPCPRQRDDMVLLAHIRSAFALSGGTYGTLRWYSTRYATGTLTSFART